MNLSSGGIRLAATLVKKKLIIVKREENMQSNFSNPYPNSTLDPFSKKRKGCRHRNSSDGNQ